MVFYRKYRPQRIEDLDSTAVRGTLIALLSQSVMTSPDQPADSVTHAFLFTGPKGLGKTSTARIIAKAVNCEANAFALRGKGPRGKGQIGNNTKETSPQTSNLKASQPSIEPCNQCAQCVSITNGTNLDVIEIDAASNRGIDEIRELKERITLSPAHARKKVYIIDEVHMLTTEAFNALLKTLEEPPSHAMFILCTTELHKVPATILSRCFHLHFSSATTEELERALRRVVQGEKLHITPEALHVIAQYADGGFRDGTKLLEEVAALSAGKEITVETVEGKLHIKSFAMYVDQLFISLDRRDTAPGLDLIEKLMTEKVDMQYFLQEVLKKLHEMFLEQFKIQNAKVKNENQNVHFTNDEIQVLVQLFTDAFMKTKQAFLPQLAVEMAIVRWNQESRIKNKGNEVVDLGLKEKKGQQVENKGKSELLAKGQGLIANDATVSVGSLRKQVNEIAKIKALYGEQAVVTKTTVESDKAVETTSVQLFDFTKEGEITPEWLNAFWICMIGEVKKYNHTLAGVLRGSKIRGFDRKKLIIETAYQFHKDRLTEGKNQKTLEDICKGLIGKPVVVSIELTNNPINK